MLVCRQNKKRVQWKEIKLTLQHSFVKQFKQKCSYYVYKTQPTEKLKQLNCKLRFSNFQIRKTKKKGFY